MNLRHITKWISCEEMKLLLCNKEDKEIKSWLLEDGPITERIKSKGDFELELIKDKVDSVHEDEISFLNNIDGEIKVREVLLYENRKPKVWARSCIPLKTIKNGFSLLGELGKKPLGDILFEKDIFKKKEVLYSTFYYGDLKKVHWGRKTKYHVNNLPFSVMEVFLIKPTKLKDNAREET